MKLFSYIALALAVLTACGGKGEDMPTEVQSDDCWRRTDGRLVFTQLSETQTSAPSKISIRFKLDDRDGQPIPGLTEANFNIYEQTQSNSCLQPISEFEALRSIQREQRSFIQHTLILLDLSGSVITFQEELKAATRTLINEIDPTESSLNKIGVWWFDGAADLHELIAPTFNKESILESIDKIKTDLSKDNSTNLYGAVASIAQKANMIMEANSGVSGVSVVLFTDGKDRANRVSKQNAYDAVNESNSAISFFTVGLGSEINKNDLEQFGRDRFVNISKVNELSATFQEIASFVQAESNSYYLLEYCSPIRNGANNVLIVEAVQGDNKGYLESNFDATGFEGGCEL